jgi:histidinol-phosphate phosphatase family protein
MPKLSNSLNDIRKTEGWSLFLDRDGVINTRLVDDYVKCWEDFEFLPGVPEAIKTFNDLFINIFVVTNQQGIGKGLMSVETLNSIHSRMVDAIIAKGGRIDQIYFCPDLKESNSLYRKPNVGMGLKARKEFPSVRFRKSMIAGDSIGDMQFGKKLGMITALISDSDELIKKHPGVIDYRFNSLRDLANFII